MDDMITMAVSRTSAKELPKAASSTTEPLYLHKIASACTKILKADLTSHSRSCAKDLFDTVTALLSSCCRPAVPASREPLSSVIDLLIDYSVHRDYFKAHLLSPGDLENVYQFLGKALGSADVAVNDAAIRCVFVLGDLDRQGDVEKGDQVVGALLEALLRDRSMGLWQSGVSALTATFKPNSGHSMKLIQFLADVYERTENLPVEDLVHALLTVLDNHRKLRESGVFAAFCQQCYREGLSDCLGVAIDTVLESFGRGSPLYDDIVKAQQTPTYIQYVCGELRNPKSDQEVVMQVMERMAKVLRDGDTGTVKVAQETGLAGAVESSVCRLALDDDMPVVDKRIRTAARFILSITL